MPLHDHFRGPLSTRRHWTSFHGAWATYIAEDLNSRLLPGYFAEPLAQFNLEIDVATWDETSESRSAGSSWAPGPPQMSVPFALTTDIVEVLIFRNEGGPVLAGAIELVSPANKDRPPTRDAFVDKCASYLHQGVGLVIVDIVTERTANLHALLLERVVPGHAGGGEENLYAGAYRPVSQDGATSLDAWYEPLGLGAPLPTMPLWLKAGPCMAIPLESAYETTIQRQRVLANGA
jgi:hypothetical protein